MSTAPVPAYPVVFVDVAADGSAHVNVAGRHEHFDPNDPATTRQAVTAYAAAIAAELRRPVRMKITDPDGQWLVAVHPTGTVTELADAPEKPKRPRRQKVTVPTAAAPTIARAPSPAPASADVTAPVDAPAHRTAASPAEVSPEVAWELDHTRVARRGELATVLVPTAVLSFSTGDVARVTGAALIGRRPSPSDGEDVDLTVTVDDQSRELSRTHLRVEWHDGGLWATDRDSANGTTVERPGRPPLDLTPWQPLQLRHGDTLVLGDVHLTVSLEAIDADVNPR
ncbi:FHA domain-containing protein [Microbacterium testaceum]|uniref:FHA domain-containing protein n=1 Tax=Microbacterium testaceum TaxID=2033 RepID=UPI0034433122